MEDHGGLVPGSLLSYLDVGEREHLLARGISRSFGPEELLLHEGDPTTHVLVLTTGWVRVYAATPEGHEVMIGLRGPGDVIGDIAALSGSERNASVRTMEPVTVVQLLSEQFVACLYDRPGIAIGMIKQMSVRLAEAQAVWVDSATLDVTKRVARCLLRLIDAHGVAEPEGVALGIPLSQQDIANRVGASLRAVARALAILRERQILATSRRRFVVARPEVLRLFAGSR
jgi:CRP/FNR family transcriptional regulator, cyclic AMP receptor protein